eukprot:980898_1
MRTNGSMIVSQAIHNLPMTTKEDKYRSIQNRDTRGIRTFELVVSVKIHLMIEKPYADGRGLNVVIKEMPKWFTATIKDVINESVDDKPKQKQIARKLKCQTKGKKLWIPHNIMEFGCILKFDFSA